MIKNLNQSFLNVFWMMLLIAEEKINPISYLIKVMGINYGNVNYTVEVCPEKSLDMKLPVHWSSQIP